MALTPATTHSAQYADATNGAYQTKCGMALAAYCTTVKNEAAGTANHANRLAYVARFKADPVGETQKAAFFFAVQGSNANMTDPGDYDTAAANCWDILAGLS